MKSWSSALARTPFPVGESNARVLPRALELRPTQVYSSLPMPTHVWDSTPKTCTPARGCSSQAAVLRDWPASQRQPFDRRVGDPAADWLTATFRSRGRPPQGPGLLSVRLKGKQAVRSWHVLPPPGSMCCA